MQRKIINNINNLERKLWRSSEPIGALQVSNEGGRFLAWESVGDLDDVWAIQTNFEGEN